MTSLVAPPKVDPLLFPDPNRRVQWDGGPSLFRDLWQWDINPSPGYQSHVYRYSGELVPEYDESPCAGFSLRLNETWRLTSGAGIKILVADSGCDLTVPELSGRVFGYANAAGGSDVTDLAGHGTAVAGTIAANRDGVGICGYAPEASLYIVKTNYTSAEVPFVVNKAIEVGASIINMSYGFADDNPAAKEALIRAGEAGILVVCSALNGAYDMAAQPDYPAHWQLPNVLVVSNSMMSDTPYPFAGYSSTLVHLYAPGRLVITPRLGGWIGGGYNYTSGTSFSAPRVAAALALIKSRKPNLSPLGLINCLLAAVDRSWDYNSKCISGGRLNVGWAVHGAELSLAVNGSQATLNVQGPRLGNADVQTTENFSAWRSLGTMQLDAFGRGQLELPPGNSGFFQVELLPQPLAYMAAARFSAPKLSADKIKKIRKNMSLTIKLP